MNKLINTRSLMLLNNSRLIHTSSANFLDQKWRKKMRLPANPNLEGPLTNLPDYTYMDGRTTPLGQRQKRKILFQRELAGKILTGIQEINYAVERHERLQKEEQDQVKNIQDSKLKQKGHFLLKK